MQPRKKKPRDKLHFSKKVYGLQVLDFFDYGITLDPEIAEEHKLYDVKLQHGFSWSQSKSIGFDKILLVRRN